MIPQWSLVYEGFNLLLTNWVRNLNYLLIWDVKCGMDKDVRYRVR